MRARFARRAFVQLPAGHTDADGRSRVRSVVAGKWICER